MQQLKASAAFSDTKPHYDLLDGLRGVAAILVLWYHVFEGYAFAANAPIIETPNHAYLAVDFFFSCPDLSSLMRMTTAGENQCLPATSLSAV